MACPFAKNIATGTIATFVKEFTCLGLNGMAHPVVTVFGALVVESLC